MLFYSHFLKLYLFKSFNVKNSTNINFDITIHSIVKFENFMVQLM